MTDSSWTNYQNNPDGILEFSKVNSTDVAIFIKTPETFSGFNATARAILDELKKWHARIRKHNSTEFHPTLLLSLEQIYDALKKYPSLNEETSSYEAIVESLLFLAGYSKKSLDKYIYIYPYLAESGDQIFPKILIIAPQNEAKTPMASYREACFKASVPYLEKFFLEKIKSDRSLRNFSPILKNPETGDDAYSPFSMSIEFELHDFLRRGFFDNFYIPMTDFVNDAVHYGTSGNLLMEMTPEYHLIKDEPKVFDKDLFLKSEILMHLKNQSSALLNFTERQLAKYITDEIPELQRSWRGLNDICKNEKEYYITEEFLNLESEIIAKFPFDEYPTETLKKFRKDAEFAISILNPLRREWAYSRNLRLEMAIVNVCQKLFREIEVHIGTKLVLYEMNLEEKLKESEYVPAVELGKLREKMLDGIHSRFLFHIEKISDGKEKYFISSKDVILKSVENLRELSKIDANYQKQFQIASSLLHESDFFDKKDKHATASIRKESEGQKVESFRPDYVHGGIGFLTSFLFFVLLYLLFSNVIYLFLGFFISAIMGVALSILSPMLLNKERKTPNKKSVSGISEHSSVTNPVQRQSSDNAGDSASRAFEKMFVGKQYDSIEERVFDGNSLSAQIKNNFKEIVKDVPEYARDFQNEKHLAKIEESILSHSMCVIHIPLDLVVGKKSDRIILYKQDLRSSAKRKELAAHFRNKAERFGYDKDLVRYYNFIIHAIEIGFAKYV